MNERLEPLFHHSCSTNGQKGTWKGAPLHKSSGKWKLKPQRVRKAATLKRQISRIDEDMEPLNSHMLVGRRSVATTVGNSEADFIFTPWLGNSIHTPNSNRNGPSWSRHSSTALHRPALHTPKHPALWSGHTETQWYSDYYRTRMTHHSYRNNMMNSTMLKQKKTEVWMNMRDWQSYFF